MRVFTVCFASLSVDCVSLNVISYSCCTTSYFSNASPVPHPLPGYPPALRFLVLSRSEKIKIKKNWKRSLELRGPVPQNKFMEPEDNNTQSQHGGNALWRKEKSTPSFAVRQKIWVGFMTLTREKKEIKFICFPLSEI